MLGPRHSACSPPSAARPVEPAATAGGGDRRPAPSCATPATTLGHDSIYDGNSYMLAAAVPRAGAIPNRVGIVPDDAARFLETLAGRSWSGPTSWSPPAASRRATTTS